MASSLQQQLRQIQKNNVLKSGKIRRAPSLLYDPKVAADMDLDQIFTVAVEGFHELVSVEPRLLHFEKTLLAETSIEVDRLLLSKEENDKLNKESRAILRHLAPYLPHKNTLKVLEWLVRRFSIQEYVSDEFILSFLPFHDHPFFGRVLFCAKPKSRCLQFLTHAIKARTVPSRTDIVHMMVKDKEFFALYAQTVQAAAEEACTYPILSRFWAGISLEVIACWANDNVAADTIIDRVFVSASYAACYPSSEEFRLAGFMILTGLSSCVPLASNVVQVLIEAVCEKCSSETLFSTLMFISQLVQTHTGTVVLKKEIVLKLSGLAAGKALEKISQNCCINKFLYLYWSTLIREACTPEVVEEFCSSFSLLRLTKQEAISLLQLLHAVSPNVEISECRKALEQVETKSTNVEDEVVTFEATEKDSKRERAELVKALTREIAEFSINDYKNKNVVSLADRVAIIDKRLFSKLTKKFDNELELLAQIIVSGNSDSQDLAFSRFEENIRNNENVDYQAFIPYLLFGLANPSEKVRTSCMSALSSYSVSVKHLQQVSEHEDSKQKITIYSLNDENSSVLKWLSYTELNSLLDDIIGSRKEEILVDPNYVLTYLSERLSSEKKQKDLSHKAAIVSFLSSHVIGNRFSEVRVFLLSVLDGVKEYTREIASQFLVPVLEEYVSGKRDLSTLSLDEAAGLVNLATHQDFTVLIALVSKPSNAASAACRRLVQLQSKLKNSGRLEFVRLLLNMELPPSYVSETLEAIDVPTSVFSSLLAELDLTSEVAPAASAKKVKKTAALQPKIQILTRILELLEQKDPTSHIALLSGLFEILNFVISSRDEIQFSAYLLQLLLGILYTMVSATTIEEAPPSIRIDILVNCIRSSTNPQVQNRALLLVGALASVESSAVLHGVMPIFTFMGTTLLSRDDAFSSHAIEQTVKRVVPALLSGSTDVNAAVLISCFVNAFPHIPQHRRLRLFVTLLQTMGVSKYLSSFLIQFSEKLLHIKSTHAKVIQDFCLLLVRTISLGDRFTAIEQCIGACVQLRKSELEVGEKHDKDHSEIKLEQIPFEISAASVANLRLNIIELISLICKSKQFELDLAMTLESDAKKFELLERGISDSVSLLMELDEILTTENEKEAVYAALRNIISLLPISSFAAVIKELLHDNRVLLRRSALTLLQFRVRQGTNVSVLGSLVEDVTANISENVDEETTQMAMECLSFMARRFMQQVEIFVPAVSSVIGSAGLKSSSKDVQVSAIFVPFTLEILNNAINDEEGSLVELACIHDDRLIQAALTSSRAFDSESIGEMLFETVAKYIPTRLLFKAILQVWPDCVKIGPTAAIRLFDLIGLGIDNATRSARRSLLFAEELDNVETKSVNVFLKFVMKLSDSTFRPLFFRLHSWALQDLVSTDPAGLTARQIFFYNFFTVFLKSLTSIVTNYYAYVLDDTVDLLASKETNGELRQLILSSLANAFENDSEEFWLVPARFNKIAPVLIEQISYAPLLDNSTLIKAVVELASTAASDDNFKAINTPLLQYLRSETVDVRVLAIQMETELYKRLNEDWLTTLPQSVPFIAELMEEDDDQVESATTELIKVIEDRLGDSESLQDYLT
ncbi:U3 snoRNP-associated protein Utp10 [Schizosaccharomyces japonicus yFS275]|uniref:U3 small nucleolar RNA-associated protein 10 n=1 Tax=Schizosaccharomyces japonicus (strain yFS275 / FY16936) TaxID=402676 RepID=B6JVR2_SCHJY|nr:U3 snoRNP-associated protein Utp10 [Schizosaccharomyces japonicus yFS275]EEB05463.2 U3 snoRNP-associated protein Utp10 [Schizosaccharomyces japonicus yFS275]